MRVQLYSYPFHPFPLALVLSLLSLFTLPLVYLAPYFFSLSLSRRIRVYSLPFHPFPLLLSPPFLKYSVIFFFTSLCLLLSLPLIRVPGRAVLQQEPLSLRAAISSSQLEQSYLCLVPSLSATQNKQRNKIKKQEGKEKSRGLRQEHIYFLSVSDELL